MKVQTKHTLNDFLPFPKIETLATFTSQSLLSLSHQCNANIYSLTIKCSLSPLLAFSQQRWSTLPPTFVSTPSSSPIVLLIFHLLWRLFDSGL